MRGGGARVVAVGGLQVWFGLSLNFLPKRFQNQLEFGDTVSAVRNMEGWQSEAQPRGAGARAPEFLGGWAHMGAFS